ncbi:MAG: hypothetical protein MZU95_09105 [Desulfomicrobium escambiense]|nr:hypothetical protein [Desulfomicrobium escambiense]
MEEKIRELVKRREKIAGGGGPKRVAAQHEKGKMTARERIEPAPRRGHASSSSTPSSSTAATDLGMAEVEAPGEGVVIGYGTVDGRIVYVFAQDFTVHRRLPGRDARRQDLQGHGHGHEGRAARASASTTPAAPASRRASTPSPATATSSTATPWPPGVIPADLRHHGALRRRRRLLARPSPTSSSWSTRRANMFITGPQVIKAVTGEDVTAEDLGRRPGPQRDAAACAHFMLATTRPTPSQASSSCSRYLPPNNIEDAARRRPADDPRRVRRRRSTDIIPDEPNKPYDIRDVIAARRRRRRLLRGPAPTTPRTSSSASPGWTAGPSASSPTSPSILAGVPGHQRLRQGRAASSASATPSTSRSSPSSTSPGYLPGVGQEHGGIIRHGAKLLYAYSEATVPKLTVIMRKAYGGAYIAMCSRHLGADHGLRLAQRRDRGHGARRRGQHHLQEGDRGSRRSGRHAQGEDRRVQARASPTRTRRPSRGYVDDVIDPRETRPGWSTALAMLRGQARDPPAPRSTATSRSREGGHGERRHPCDGSRVLGAWARSSVALIVIALLDARVFRYRRRPAALAEQKRPQAASGRAPRPRPPDEPLAAFAGTGAETGVVAAIIAAVAALRAGGDRDSAARVRRRHRRPVGRAGHQRPGLGHGDMASGAGRR